MSGTFVWIYHPQLGNRQAYVPLSSVDDHAARGWLLVDPGVTPPAPTVPYTTVAQVASQLSTGTGPIGLAGRAAFVPRDEYVPGDGGGTVDLDGTPLELRYTGAPPPRPATSRPVHFIGPTAPAGDGSTAGGGGMVPGLDAWFWWAPQ